MLIGCRVASACKTPWNFYCDCHNASYFSRRNSAFKWLLKWEFLKERRNKFLFIPEKRASKAMKCGFYVFCHRTWRRSFVVEFWESGPPEVPWNALNYFRFGRFFLVFPSKANTSEPFKQAIGTGSLSRYRHPLDIHNRSPVQQKQLRNIRATLRTVFALFHLSDSRSEIRWITPDCRYFI